MKKAQIQYMETIFVLLVLIIIIFIGIIVIYSFYSKSLNEKRESFQDIDAVTLTSSIVNLPEFNCGKTSNCLDVMKLIAFKSLQNKPYYKTLFKNMDITIDIVYPQTNSNINCLDPNVYSQTDFPINCGKFELYKSQAQVANKEIIQTPVQIYFPSLQKKALAIFNIIVYKK